MKKYMRKRMMKTALCAALVVALCLPAGVTLCSDVETEPQAPAQEAQTPAAVAEVPQTPAPSEDPTAGDNGVTQDTAVTADTDTTDTAPAADVDTTDTAPAADTNTTDTAPAADTDTTDTTPAADTDTTDTAPAPGTDTTDTAPAPETPSDSTTQGSETPETEPQPSEGEGTEETTPAAEDPTEPTETEIIPDNQTPAAAPHIEGCADGCTAEGCLCPCHEKTLFERLMACQTLEEIFAILDETPEEDLLTLTEEENAQIDAKITALEPEPAPAIVLEVSEPPVPSEIICPTVNFDDVAPFGDPVQG